MSEEVDWKKPLILATTLLVLAGGAYWREFKQRPAREEAQEAGKKLFNLSDRSVDTIELHDGARSFILKCSEPADSKLCKPGDNSRWEITAPMKARADDSNVNSLLSAINHLTSGDTIDLAIETEQKRQTLLKEYGLASSQRALGTGRRVHVALRDGTLIRAYLGETHPMGESFFAISGTGRVDMSSEPADENKVFLVPQYFSSNLDKDLTYWRDKKLLTLTASQVAGFNLVSPRGKLSANKKDGQWSLSDGGPAITGDIELVDNFLSTTAFLAARRFVSESKTDARGRAALSGARPMITLKLIPTAPEGKPADEVTLTVYHPKMAASKITLETPLMATVSNVDPVFELDASVKAKLDKGLKDLRLTQFITSVEKFSAKRLSFEGGKLPKPITISQLDGKWVYEGAPPQAGATPAPAKIQAFLDKISGSRIREFIPLAKAPKGQEQGLRFTLGDETQAAKRKFVFWKSDQKLYARDLTSARPEVYSVDTSVGDVLPWEGSTF